MRHFPLVAVYLMSVSAGPSGPSLLAGLKASGPLGAPRGQTQAALEGVRVRGAEGKSGWSGRDDKVQPGQSERRSPAARGRRGGVTLRHEESIPVKVKSFIK